LPGVPGSLLFPSIIPARLLGAECAGQKNSGCAKSVVAAWSQRHGQCFDRAAAASSRCATWIPSASPPVKKNAEDYYTLRGESGVNVKCFMITTTFLASRTLTRGHHCAGSFARARCHRGGGAGKHIYVQEPVTYNIAEAIALRKTVEAKKIFCRPVHNSAPSVRG